MKEKIIQCVLDYIEHFNHLIDNMNKTKLGIVGLVMGTFLLGGAAFTAFQAMAGESGDDGEHFWKSGLHGEIDKNSPEWQAKMEKMKTRWDENGGKHGMGHFGFMKGADDANHDVVILDNGIQITITSDNQETVDKLHEMATKMQEKADNAESES